MGPRQDGRRCALQSEPSAVAETVRSYLDDQEGDLLLHLLMADLLRLTVGVFRVGKPDVARRLLDFVDRCPEEGDANVRNVVLVSFVEDYGYGPDELEELLILWPGGLRAELGR
jgi:hypothetical protein